MKKYFRETDILRARFRYLMDKEDLGPLCWEATVGPTDVVNQQGITIDPRIGPEVGKTIKAGDNANG